MQGQRKPRHDPGNNYVQYCLQKNSRVLGVCRRVLERPQETLLTKHAGMMAETSIEQVSLYDIPTRERAIVHQPGID